jgi:hypothetical protein
MGKGLLSGWGGWLPPLSDSPWSVMSEPLSGCNSLGPQTLFANHGREEGTFLSSYCVPSIGWDTKCHFNLMIIYRVSAILNSILQRRKLRSERGSNLLKGTGQN